MTDEELALIAKAIAPVIKSGVEQAMGGLIARVGALEQRTAVPGRDGRDGIQGPQGEKGPPGERGEKGLDGVHGKDGADGREGKDGAPGLDGKDGHDGVDGKDGQPGLNGKEGLDGAAGKDGAPGLDGKDGAPGMSGKDGSHGRDGKDGSDGLNGKDGRDGVDFTPADLISVTFDGAKTLTLHFQRGEVSKSFAVKTAFPVYRGVFADGVAYEPGDLVTWAGSMWVAKALTTAKPGLNTEDSRQWTLCVKAGREGKPGRDGKDLTKVERH